MTYTTGSYCIDAAMVTLMMLLITGVLMWATTDADV